MDRAYANIRYPYVFVGPEDPPHLLGVMIIASIYVKGSQKLVPENREKGALSPESHITVDADDANPTVSANDVPSSAHPAELKTLVSSSISVGSAIALEPRKAPTLRSLRIPTK